MPPLLLIGPRGYCRAIANRLGQILLPGLVSIVHNRVQAYCWTFNAGMLGNQSLTRKSWKRNSSETVQKLAAMT
jgi:hypothetical protein